jgi:hypothetical protein
MLFHNLNRTAEKSDFFIKNFTEVPLYMVINSFKYWTAIYLIYRISSNAEEKGKHAAAKFLNVDRKRVCLPVQLLLISDA